MSRTSPTPPAALWFWICLCVFCNCAGWVLSGLGQLNAKGYAVALVIGGVVLWLLRKRVPQFLNCRGFHKLRNRFRPYFLSWVGPVRRTGGPATNILVQRTARSANGPYLDCAPHQRLRPYFRRSFPLAFLLLACLAILGGALYAPTNYDALAYRTPRVLNWLAEGHWHWIHTEFNRLNTRAMGYEWLATPLIALTKTDRFLFLINVASFLLLPGLVFSLFRRLGIRGRVAWHWMWIVPTGYCYLLQAGGIANDLFGAVFALAAVDFALRARQSKRVQDVWLSILAAALMTDAKASNLPLLLPWAVALMPSLTLMLRKPAGSFALLLVAVPASILPLIAINLKYSGDWTGIAAENVEALEHGSLLNVANNAVLLPLQNLAPPIFPLAGKWNKAVERHMPASLRARLEKAFEPGGAHWLLGEMQIEEAAGLGFGVTLLLLCGLAAGLLHRERPPPGPEAAGGDRFALLVLACALVALLAFMLKSGLSGAARLITPYYALLIPVALMPRMQARLIRLRWWRSAAMAVFALAGLLIVLSPSRPLWPANTVLSKAAGNSPLMARAKSVYSVFSQRADSFAPARKLLPADVKVIGLVATDDPETSLWRPFGHLRVVHVTHADSPQDLGARQIRYILVNSKKLETFFHKPFNQWVADMDADVVAQLTLALRVTEGPSDWFLVKLRSK